MLNYIAMTLIFLACAGTGALISRTMMQRARQLELCLQMLAQLRAQLQYSRPPVQTMVADLCEQAQHPAFLPRCLHSMNTGVDFPQAWQGALQSPGHGLKDDDRRHLLSLGQLLGASDAAGQREALQLHESLLTTQLDQARAVRDTRGKAAFTLGVLAGLTVMILFI
ncbi:MAG: stage III sporulation protein AB [Oscillospiraceae bacterium]|nr:stage III sporulation protein AB [Oscillospiraceae bacterium]